VKLNIKVTQDHIDNGRQSMCNFCPVALAIEERLKDGVTVSVNCLGVGFSICGAPHTQFPLPDIAREFVREFDCAGRHSVIPIQFDCDISDGLLKEE